MAKEMKTYKRSDERPVIITEDHQNCINGRNITANIIKYALVAIILLTIIFNILSLVKLEVNNKELGAVSKGHDMFADITTFELFSGWFEKATYTYKDIFDPTKNVVKGYDYPNVLSYLVGRVPALKNAVGGFGSMIFGSVKDKDINMLNTGYFAMTTVEIIIMVSLLAMAVIFILSLIKKVNLSPMFANIMVIIHFILQFVMFSLVLAFVSHSTPEFGFEVGIGMWLNLLFATIALGFVIANFIYAGKAKMYEEQAK